MLASGDGPRSGKIVAPPPPAAAAAAPGAGTAAGLTFVYTYYLFRYLAPVITIGALTRSFAPADLAAVLTGQSVSVMGAQVVEYGFGLAGPRDIAAAPDHPGRSAVTSAIASAQMLLMGPAVAVCLALTIASPILRHRMGEAAPVCVYALVGGIGPGWYLQGTGRARLAAILEGIGQFAAIVVLLAGLRSGTGPAGALWAIAAGPAVSSLAGWRMVLRENRLALSFRAALSSVRHGLALFLTRASLTSYTAASVWLMTLFCTPAEVARFGPALRIATGVSGLFTPLAQVMLPAIVRLGAAGRAALDAMRIRLALILTSGGILGAIGLGAGAGVCCRLLFGGTASAPSLSILALMLPAVALSQFVGTYVLIPERQDRRLAISVVVGALANILFTVLFAAPFGALGMAAGRVGAESAVALVQIAYALPVLAGLHRTLRDGGARQEGRQPPPTPAGPPR